MVDFGMRNDDEFYNKMESSTAVSTKTAFAIAMDGICGWGVVLVVATVAVLMMMMGILRVGVDGNDGLDINLGVQIIF